MATVDNAIKSFGSKVFNMKVMRNYVSESAYMKLQDVMQNGGELDPAIADEIADAMKNWSMENGATHYTHWFQPLTGATAEKHDSFIVPDGSGGVIARFSGKELVQGEPDASSLPSGGLRSTFEARGYTGWDPSSPAFIKYSEQGAATLCIPSVFCGYHGDALDKKTPLLRSLNVLSGQLLRLGRMFGIEGNCPPVATLGCEQEYFLIDRDLYEKRLDIQQCGRTLFGVAPAKHQQLSDHYFGSIKSRVIAFMADLDAELWRMGVPAKTRHNEVAPAQFEIAPVYEYLNLAVDHNMITMEVLRDIADRHGFVCLLHEKPYAGLNGSGKHNNWSICGCDGRNWLSPGDNPHENATFLTLICALIKAVDTHADLLRASIASAGNDHRLGGHEAPPCVISIFLGDCLSDIVEQIEKGGACTSKNGGSISFGLKTLPELPRGNTDRNRTSAFAFTGDKFEFRAVGSNQNPAGANVVLNTIVAEAVDGICTAMEAALANGKDFTEELQKILAEIIRDHKRVLFNGDGYTAEWLAEAESRGLPNLKTTPEALAVLNSEKVKKLFSHYGVLTEGELESRYIIYSECFEEQIAIETNTALTMVRTMIVPATGEAIRMLGESLEVQKRNGLASEEQEKKLQAMVSELENTLRKARILDEAKEVGQRSAALEELRNSVDQLEGMVPKGIWPLPSYAEMLSLQ